MSNKYNHGDRNSSKIYKSEHSTQSSNSQFKNPKFYKTNSFNPMKFFPNNHEERHNYKNKQNILETTIDKHSESHIRKNKFNPLSEQEEIIQEVNNEFYAQINKPNIRLTYKHNDFFPKRQLIEEDLTEKKIDIKTQCSSNSTSNSSSRNSTSGIQYEEVNKNLPYNTTFNENNLMLTNMNFQQNYNFIIPNFQYYENNYPFQYLCRDENTSRIVLPKCPIRKIEEKKSTKRNHIIKSSFNKFNSNDHENTEILKININYNKKSYQMILNKYDDLSIKIRDFIDTNNIPDKFIQPILMKICQSMNQIFNIYNTNLSKFNIEYLNSLQKLWLSRSNNISNSIKQEDDLSDVENNISSISNISLDKNEIDPPFFKLNKSF